ncbi:blue (type 1) copper domain-containing protein [Catenovulum agarivorans DS-2]|uniref:Blue (Type 1) copper domain-containing protein n=1 Tax=Catenovulum agarivorans DS-2 TaxID=1328313 RepID=W7QZC9_9ALTE|nr:c-type cytochrome [Catenovulum agarivorans]EWH10715.1 blue (type 1) copper domain-containing protein [Catenovulum agarivorans DS-2]
MKLKNKKTIKRAVLLLFSGAISQPSYAIDQGKLAFEANCKACHSLAKFSTGPSLVYIRDQYPANKQAEFLEWVKAPGKKNPDTIQMPPMGHLSELTIKQIHQYILLISQHVVEQKSKPKFAPYKPPAKTYPSVTRGYLPFTNPASIVVHLTPKLSLAWDTNLGQLRYAFPTFAPFYGEKKRQQNKQQIIYSETSEVGFNFAKGQAVNFLGYKFINDSPEFSYQINGYQVKEQIRLGATKTSFIREYQVTRLNRDHIPTQPITLDLSHTNKGGESGKTSQIIASNGRLTNKVLHLTEQQAKNFSVEVVLP